MTAPGTGVAPPFHLAFPVHDLEAARSFYGGILGCSEGRSSDRWVDFDLYGHQVVAHLVKNEGLLTPHENEVDHEAVPVPHFGLVLPWEEWEAMAERLKEASVPFVIEPSVRFRDQVGEQGTLFVRDPSGNALEFKAFRDPARLFASD